MSNWEAKINGLITLAKAAGRFLNSGTNNDYHDDAQRTLRDAYEDFCQWRHEEPYVVDEIKELLSDTKAIR